ncbi:TetR/AcrR family transcriptional regulator [Paenibacillus sp. NPDC055715]
MTKNNLRQQKAFETKNRLIDSALKVFSSKGFVASTTKDIAKEAGITDGLIYHYFSSKEELLWAVIDKHTLNHDLKFMSMQSSDETPLKVLLNRYFLQLLNMLKSKEELIVMFFGEAQRNPEIRGHLMKIIEQGLEPLYTLVKDRVYIDEHYVRAAVKNIQITLVMYFLLYDRFNSFENQREEYVKMTVDQFLRVIN